MEMKCSILIAVLTVSRTKGQDHIYTVTQYLKTVDGFNTKSSFIFESMMFIFCTMMTNGL